MSFGKKHRSLYLCLLVATLVISLLAFSNRAQAAETGTCGINLTWTLDTEGTLTISGTGPMTNYISGEAPWYSGKESILAVVIGKGVTSIGQGAFADCTRLTSVIIPDSVTGIRGTAFRNCKSLTSVIIPDSVTSIGYFAFADCTGLTNITIPDSVTIIDNSAFEDCASLTSVTIPDSVTGIGKYAFWN